MTLRSVAAGTVTSSERCLIERIPKSILARPREPDNAAIGFASDSGQFADPAEQAGPIQPTA